MNLESLRHRKLDVLHDLADKALCNYSTSSIKALSAHMQSCEKCIRMKVLGEEYEALRKAEKALLGRTNALEIENRVNPSPRRLKWRKIAIARGISKDTFNKRVRNGYSYEQAAMTPIFSNRESGKRSAEARRKRA